MYTKQMGIRPVLAANAFMCFFSFNIFYINQVKAQTPEIVLFMTNRENLLLLNGVVHDGVLKRRNYPKRLSRILHSLRST